MIKSDGNIKTSIYLYLKGSRLEQTITGVLSKNGRKTSKEDVVISVLANEAGQIQEAFVNVNIYVPDLFDSKQYVINDKRVDELSDIASGLLEVYNGDSFRFDIKHQRVYKVEGVNEHCINNRLLYRQLNEKLTI